MRLNLCKLPDKCNVTLTSFWDENVQLLLITLADLERSQMVTFASEQCRIPALQDISAL